MLCALPSGAQRHRYLARGHAGAASVRAVAIVGGVQVATWAGAGLVRTLGENDRHGCSWSGRWQLPVDPVLAWLVQHIGAAGHPGRPRWRMKRVGVPVLRGPTLSFV